MSNNKNIDIQNLINLIEKTKQEISNSNDKNKINLDIYNNLLETIIIEYHNCCTNIFTSIKL